MRVLHVADRLAGRGGAHRYLEALVAAQRTRGDEVHVAGAGGAGRRGHQPSTVAIAALDARTRDASPLAALDALVQSVQPDVVHLHTIVNPAVLEWARTQPAVVSVQDHRYFCPTRGKWTLDGRVCREPMAGEVCRACFEDADYFAAVYALTEQRLRALRDLPVTVLSAYMRAELVAAGLARERVTVAPPFVHGLDLDARPDGPPCVLFAGRLTEAKGVRDAIAAWRLAGAPLPLVFAGTGPLRAALEAEGFTVLGWLPPARLSSVYRRAAALLLPSRWQEPFGLVGLEALALATPVVAWDSGGVREWHPGGAGLVAWGDVDGLARALQQALAEGRGAAPPRPGFERDTALARLAEAYATASRRAVRACLRRPRAKLR